MSVAMGVSPAARAMPAGGRRSDSPRYRLRAWARAGSTSRRRSPLVLQVAEQTLLVDRAEGAGAEPEPHGPLQLGYPHGLPLQVGKLTPLGLVVGVADGVPGEGALAGQLAGPGHGRRGF